ncbi:PCC domain-containing protein [Jiella sonneratiae]|uniref:DUF296 domain-containing protein n=1 Tax=Jiella sonneratiae TaxID=2816856 RepID=A0ABS3J1E8_9HYPH|nr:DUF296 domain-containing protein [Jiella sonneratiae]MBO0902917.1 DUF296 domain-containing protein [Jiella sonneratiae]
MTNELRQIRHPGPVATIRHASAWGGAVRLDVTVEPGETMEAGLGRAVAAAGCDAAYVAMAGARLSPFRYVMPAGSPGPDHAAWYSNTFAPEGVVTVEEAGAIVGRRDGAPFVHCHGLWRAGTGPLAMGHMLPAESRAAEPVRITGVGLRGAVFESRQDVETNFRLFAAERAASAASGLRPAGPAALALTLRPNQDVSAAIEAICAEEGIAAARIHGIGSLNGARFAAGPAMHSYASELLIRRGHLAEGRARLDVAVVAMDGTIFEGVLVRGENPVCVTFELVVVPE